MTKVKGSCHCGAVTLSVPHAPEWVASCNCSLCTKTGWLVAYYPDDQVTVDGETIPYIWGDRMIGIHHCPICGCGTHWKTSARISAGWASMPGCWTDSMWGRSRCG